MLTLCQDGETAQPSLERLSLRHRAADVPLRFIVDSALNKLCRWLRILGFDCALAAEAKPQQAMFERARAEGRLIVTCSKGLLKRRQCPEAFLVDARDLDGSLVKLVRAYVTPARSSCPTTPTSSH